MRKIRMMDLLEAIELSNLQGEYFYNKTTGETVFISDDERRMAADYNEEEIKELPEWQKEAVEMAIDTEVNWHNYIALPSRLDINQYDMMVNFCYSLENNNICNKLLYDLNGKGAFRRFKYNIMKFELKKKWYDFKANAQRKIAIEWSENNNVKIKED